MHVTPVTRDAQVMPSYRIALPYGNVAYAGLNRPLSYRMPPEQRSRPLPLGLKLQPCLDARSDLAVRVEAAVLQLHQVVGAADLIEQRSCPGRR